MGVKIIVDLPKSEYEYLAKLALKGDEQIGHYERTLIGGKPLSMVLDKIRAEINGKIEQEEFARSVFRHEEKDTAKAEQCTGSIMAYNNVIKFIDKYKTESEE